MSTIGNKNKENHNSGHAGMLQILNGLQQIADNTGQKITPFEVEADLDIATGPGIASVPKGAKIVSFMNIGAADTTVAGGTLAAGQSVSFPEVIGGVYKKIEYNPLSSTLLIAETR